MSYDDGWLPGWEYVENPRSGGGTYDPEGEGYPWRFVGHSIEGENIPNTSTHQYPPQLWYNRRTRQKIQTISLLRSGFALYQSPVAPYYTNRARALQCEVTGRAVESMDWTERELRNIAEDVLVPVIRFVRAQGSDLDLSDPAVPEPGQVSSSAYEDAPQRLEPAIWAFGPVGYVGHRHVPMGDDHWDELSPHRLIARYAKEILGEAGGSTNPVPTTKRKLREAMEFYARYNPNTNQLVEGPPSYGFNGPVNFYDFPLVPAGAKVTVTGMYPEVPPFNATLVIANEATPVQAAQLVRWGLPSQTVVKSDSFVTVVVPAGFPCRVVAVG